MPDVAGFFYPRTATGRSSLLPPPPWHYSGDLLTVEYRTDPARVAELLPEPLRPAPDDPGAVARAPFATPRGACSRPPGRISSSRFQPYSRPRVAYRDGHGGSLPVEICAPGNFHPAAPGMARNALSTRFSRTCSRR